MKCFYHSSDLDGQCSGALIKMEYPECEMYGLDYGDDFPWDIIKQNETVFLVDFSLKPYIETVYLAELLGNNFIWIDHHISAMNTIETEYSKRNNGRINGIRRIGTAACELTWEYLHPTKEIPTFVKLLGRYDVWDHSDPRTLPFQYGIKQYDTSPESGIWIGVWFNNIVTGVIQEGETILKYINRDYERNINKFAFDVDFDGYKCIAVNIPCANSRIFDGIGNKDQYDIMITFGFQNGSWRIRLYSDKEDIDITALATKYGGGGHSMICDVLPFELK